MHNKHSHRASHPDPDTSPGRGTPPGGGSTSWAMLALLCVPQFMVILDITIVNVALPSIGRHLGFSAGDLQWVVSAYVLMTGGLMLLGGRGADLIGRRTVLLAGIAIFTLASLASGLAASPAMLIASRATQGLGAALLSPAALSAITATYEGPQRTTALAVWGALAGGGAAVGVLCGGILTSVLGWRSIFFVNVPVGLLTLMLVTHMLPADVRARDWRERLDLPGALAVVTGLSALVFGIRQSSTWGLGDARTLGLFAVACALLVAFTGIERRSRQPLVPPLTWRSRSLIASSAMMLGSTAILVGTFFLGSLFLQRVQHASAITTGLSFLPLVLVTGLGSHLGRELLGRVGARSTVITGLAAIAGGNLMLSGANTASSYLSGILPGFALVGFGVGLAFAAISVAAMVDASEDQAGLASGLLTTGHELGAAIGTAIVSRIAFGGSSFVVGYGHGALASAVIALLFAAVAAVAMPTNRTAVGPELAFH